MQPPRYPLLLYTRLYDYQGRKRSRRSKADIFLDNRIQHVWDGSNSRAPTDSDTEESDSDSDSSGDDASSDASQESRQSSAHDADSDLANFIVDDIAQPTADDAGAEPDATEVLQQDQAAQAASTILQDAGFRSHQSDAECFADYIEYMVYDLVDNTFSIRVRRDGPLQRQYDAAIKQIEEKLADRR